MDPTEQMSPSPSPEDGNRSSFRNAMFFRIPDDGQIKKPINSKGYTPSSNHSTYYCYMLILTTTTTTTAVAPAGTTTTTTTIITTETIT
jgi:hypothetical protein